MHLTNVKLNLLYMKMSSYLPPECLAAIAETQAKKNAMLEVWKTYVTNLVPNKNTILQKFKHVQDISDEHLLTHKFLKTYTMKQAT